MTRNELKQLIQQVISESRIRSSPMGYNAAIRAAEKKLKKQMADKDAISKADDEKLAQLKPASTLSKAVNIIARIKQLSYKIEELEFYVPKKDDESYEEYYERVIPILKQKTQLEIDRLDLVLNFEKLKK